MGQRFQNHVSPIMSVDKSKKKRIASMMMEMEIIIIIIIILHNSLELSCRKLNMWKERFNKLKSKKKC
jgi:hypothetical protein